MWLGGLILVMPLLCLRGAVTSNCKGPGKTAAATSSSVQPVRAASASTSFRSNQLQRLNKKRKADQLLVCEPLAPVAAHMTSCKLPGHHCAVCAYGAITSRPRRKLPGWIRQKPGDADSDMWLDASQGVHGTWQFGCRVCSRAGTDTVWARREVEDASALHMANLRRHSMTLKHRGATSHSKNLVAGVRVPKLKQFRNMLMNMRRGIVSTKKLQIASFEKHGT
jgi:hypothetical protein